MALSITIHGCRTCFEGGPPQPIYDLGELREAVRLRQTVRLADGRCVHRPYLLEREDGSGRSWNLHGFNFLGAKTSVWLYALLADKN